MMGTWKIENIGKRPNLKNPILITGLPGIGNVGKVAVDFIVEELKAKKVCTFSSYTFPHSVFVNENNLVELPTIALYYKKMGGKNDLLLLAGDVQPSDEVSCYEFSDRLLDIATELKTKKIVTLGGIGLHSIPKKPKVYCTGNSKKMIKDFKKGIDVDDRLYGVVGPIVGVSGLLLGLSQKREVEAVSLLAETFGHPMYLGVKGAREILKILNHKLKLHINLKELDKEIKELEKEIAKKADDFSDMPKMARLKKFRQIDGTNYIG
jgi:uncharacterized protein (TIGR00162 family)